MRYDEPVLDLLTVYTSYLDVLVVRIQEEEQEGSNFEIVMTGGGSHVTTRCRYSLF